MSVSGSHFEQHRDAMTGKQPTNGQTKVETVVKFFMSEDKIKAIKAEDTRITIGDPPMQVVVKPMNPLQVAQSYTLIRKLLLPIVGVVQAQQRGDPLNIAQMLEAFGENIDALPELMFQILRRGNNITREWCDEHLDLVLDMQMILPHFLRQNGLDRLFAGKTEAPTDGATTTPVENNSQQTAALPESLPSSVDGTDGALNTSGTT
jgi:hypothetical protein